MLRFSQPWQNKMTQIGYQILSGLGGQHRTAPYSKTLSSDFELYQIQIQFILDPRKN